MNRAEVLKRLCYYDLRNPIGVINDLTKEEIIEEGYSEEAEEDCYCDNCFYGRTKLAEKLLKYIKDETI